MTNPLKRYQYADAMKLLASSRGTTLLIFALFMLLGISLVQHGSPVNLSLGTSFIATAIVSIVLVWIQNIRSGEEARTQDLINTGIVAAYESRNLSEYADLMGQAKSVDVTGYTLRSFSEQNVETFRRRAQAGSAIQARILLVDPTSSAAVLMEQAEGFPAGHYQSALTALITRFKGIEGVSVRLLKRHLSMMVFRIDEVLYTGPYPHNGLSTTALTLKVKGGWVYDRQTRDFDALWDQAEPVDLTT